MDACRTGREDEVRDILGQEGGDAIKWVAYGTSGQNPLMCAAREGQLGVVKVLTDGEEYFLKGQLDLNKVRPAKAGGKVHVALGRMPCPWSSV